MEEGKVKFDCCNSNGLTSLHLASKEGHVDVVSFLLENKIDVNQATKRGNTAIHIASLAGQFEIAKLLIDAGANVNCQAQCGFTPLYMAAQEGHQAIVGLLLYNGADQTVCTDDGFTPLAVALQERRQEVVEILLKDDVGGRVKLPALHVAARLNDIKAAALLLQSEYSPVENPDGSQYPYVEESEMSETTEMTPKLEPRKLMINQTTESGFTALHIAAHYGNHGMTALLLKRNVIVDFEAKENITALHVACKRGHAEVVKLLIDHNADPCFETKDGLTSFHCAARGGHTHILEYLLDAIPIAKREHFIHRKTKNGLSALHMGCQHNRLDIMKYLILEHNISIDDTTNDNLTALHIACHCGHLEIAEFLLEHQADPNFQALNGWNPLHVACKKNRVEISYLLLEYGADPLSRTSSGLTPVHLAAYAGSLEILKTFFSLDENLKEIMKAVNERNEGVIHMTVRSGNLEVLTYLLEMNINVDSGTSNPICSQNIASPLQVACRLGNLKAVEILLSYGADTNRQLNDGSTFSAPLQIAIRSGHLNIVKLLVDADNIDLEITDKFAPAKAGNPVYQCFSPLLLATSVGQLTIVKMLLNEGASPDPLASQCSILHVAVYYEHLEIVEFILEFLDQESVIELLRKPVFCNMFNVLHISCCRISPQSLDISKAILDKQQLFDIQLENTRTLNGYTTLHYSCLMDNAILTKILTNEYSAMVNTSDSNGLTPTHICCIYGSTECLYVLIEKPDLKLETLSKSGFSPLSMAAHFGKLLCASTVLSQTVMPYTVPRNADGSLTKVEPLLCSIMSSHAEISLLLIDRLAEIYEQKEVS